MAKLRINPVVQMGSLVIGDVLLPVLIHDMMAALS